MLQIVEAWSAKLHLKLDFSVACHLHTSTFHAQYYHYGKSIVQKKVWKWLLEKSLADLIYDVWDLEKMCEMNMSRKP